MSKENEENRREASSKGSSNSWAGAADSSNRKTPNKDTSDGQTRTWAKVELVGDKDYKEGQLYIVRNRNGEVRKMVYKRGQLVEMKTGADSTKPQIHSKTAESEGTGGSKVRLEGQGQFQEGRVYVVKNGKESAKQKMVYRGGRLVECDPVSEGSSYQERLKPDVQNSSYSQAQQCLPRHQQPLSNHNQNHEQKNRQQQISHQQQLTRQMLQTKQRLKVLEQRHKDQQRLQHLRQQQIQKIRLQRKKEQHVRNKMDQLQDQLKQEKDKYKKQKKLWLDRLQQAQPQNNVTDMASQGRLIRLLRQRKQKQEEMVSRQQQQLRLQSLRRQQIHRQMQLKQRQRQQVSESQQQLMEGKQQSVATQQNTSDRDKRQNIGKSPRASSTQNPDQMNKAGSNDKRNIFQLFTRASKKDKDVKEANASETTMAHSRKQRQTNTNTNAEKRKLSRGEQDTIALRQGAPSSQQRHGEEQTRDKSQAAQEVLLQQTSAASSGDRNMFQLFTNHKKKGDTPNNSSKGKQPVTRGVLSCSRQIDTRDHRKSKDTKSKIQNHTIMSRVTQPSVASSASALKDRDDKRELVIGKEVKGSYPSPAIINKDEKSHSSPKKTKDNVTLLHLEEFQRPCTDAPMMMSVLSKSPKQRLKLPEAFAQKRDSPSPNRKNETPVSHMQRHHPFGNSNSRRPVATKTCQPPTSISPAVSAASDQHPRATSQIPKTPKSVKHVSYASLGLNVGGTQGIMASVSANRSKQESSSDMPSVTGESKSFTLSQHLPCTSQRQSCVSASECRQGSYASQVAKTSSAKDTSSTPGIHVYRNTTITSAQVPPKHSSSTIPNARAQQRATVAQQGGVTSVSPNIKSPASSSKQKSCLSAPPTFKTSPYASPQDCRQSRGSPYCRLHNAAFDAMHKRVTGQDKKASTTVSSSSLQTTSDSAANFRSSSPAFSPHLKQSRAPKVPNSSPSTLSMPYPKPADPLQSSSSSPTKFSRSCQKPSNPSPQIDSSPSSFSKPYQTSAGASSNADAHKSYVGSRHQSTSSQNSRPLSSSGSYQRHFMSVNSRTPIVTPQTDFYRASCDASSSTASNFTRHQQPLCSSTTLRPPVSSVPIPLPAPPHIKPSSSLTKIPTISDKTGTNSGQVPAVSTQAPTTSLHAPETTANIPTKSIEPSPDTSSSADKDQASEDEDGDCSVCFERSVNAALIPCGHLCMCYECAKSVRNGSKLCPICRQEIKDVLKVYKS